MEGYGRQQDCGPNFAVVSQFHRGESEKKHRGKKGGNKTLYDLLHGEFSRPQNRKQDSLKISFHKDELPDTSRHTNKTKTAAFPKQKKAKQNIFQIGDVDFFWIFLNKK